MIALIICLSILGAMLVIFLTCFFMIKKEFDKLIFNHNDVFFCLKHFNEKKLKLSDNLVEIYKSNSSEIQEIGSIIDEIEDFDIDIDIENMKQYFLNEALLNKKIKMIYFLIDNSTFKMNKDIINLIFTINSIEIEIKNAKKYYSIIIERFNRKIKGIIAKFIAKIYKHSPYQSIDEMKSTLNI